VSVTVLGAGAFGTALAVALAHRGEVTLWGRGCAAWAEARGNPRLPGVVVPASVRIATGPPEVAPGEGPVLLALPMQELGPFLRAHGGALSGRFAVACCKGIDLATGLGPVATLAHDCPEAVPALLTGPSFAADIARGLPTALVVASVDEGACVRLQDALATPALRLYRTTDVAGAELGGALKNVIAIGAGIVIGAGLGESARAALMTRGYAEMVRLATRLGARPATLAGLSGLGDLVLTCTSAQSRNFALGCALGAGRSPEAGVTVEGVATARAVAALARRAGVEMPVAAMVAAVVDKRLPIAEATEVLMKRPLREE
jgi:glycerol-3-phosphate dehydrogenase (NAD(P)+)